MNRLKITTLDSLAVQERKLYLTAEKRLGPPYSIAREATILLTTFVKSVAADRFAFASFMAILKKHQTLALLSIVRFHHVQAMMNFRQVLESASSAAYALANPNADYVDSTTGLPMEPKKISARSYAWIGSEFPQHSSELKDVKDSLNATTSHANLVESSRFVEAKFEEGFFGTAFFDQEDNYLTKADLLTITGGALTIMHLIWSVMQEHGGLVMADDWKQRADRVASDRVRLLAATKATPRFEKAMEASARADAARAAKRTGQDTKSTVVEG